MPPCPAPPPTFPSGPLTVYPICMIPPTSRRLTVALTAFFGLMVITTPPVPGEPEAPGSAFEHIQIQVATRIEGRLLSIDPYDDAIWVEYTRFYDGRSWRLVPFEAQLQLYPRDAAMMTFFRSLPKDTILRVTVSIGDDGKRRIVALEGT